MRNQQKIDNVLKLPGDQRYQYFVRKVADFQVIWGLYDNGWATAEANGAELIPFWPEAAFAKLCATGNWKAYVPRNIPLDIFMSKWLPGMQQDGKAAAIFPTPSDKGCVASATRLLFDIEEELQQYE